MFYVPGHMYVSDSFTPNQLYREWIVLSMGVRLIYLAHYDHIVVSKY